LRRFDPARVPELFADREVVVAQGQLANDLLLAAPALPAVIDLYDPWLVENLHYVGSLGLDPYRNDHATWVLQMSRGDYFLCSSAEQRLYYLGFLTALGRVDPERLAADPELAELVGIVPFGVDEPPPPRPLLAARRPGERRLLFGGLYDWYDPWTLLGGLARLEDVDWTLLLVRSPNAAGTPQRLLAAVEQECRRRGWWENRVRALDWVPADRRHDLLREVDVLVATHRPGLETDLALRTRFLDALAVGCPAVTTAGGTVARLLAERDAGWTVPAGDPPALAAVLRDVLAGGAQVAARAARGRELAREFAWARVLAPLTRFLARPRRDPGKERFAFRPPTVAPPDALGFRLRRWLRRRRRS
jgi:glycosyltransferase involved in cell wall biosynthesis